MHATTNRHTTLLPHLNRPKLHNNSSARAVNKKTGLVRKQIRLRGTSQPKFGTDNEPAMKQAIQKVFQNSSSICCNRHIQQNIVDHLKDIIGINTADHTAIRTSIFGADGVTSSDDQTSFDYRIQTTICIYTMAAPSFDHYFRGRVMA